MDTTVWTLRHMFKVAGSLFGHVAALIVGFVLMVVGLALGVTMVLLPVGIVVGLAGVLLVVGGLFGRMRQ